MPPETGPNGAANGLKIADLVEQTGVSKELIHHYLRQGLLPPSEEKARYSDQQVELLNLIRVLREEHHLPLDAIRQIFERFAFDLSLLETLVLAEPLAQRLAAFAAGEDLFLSPELSRDDLLAETGLSTERLERYLEQRVIQPTRVAGRERFTRFDANAVRLCEAGVAMGIPFESFRTIASYMRVSFELESGEIFASLGERQRSTDQLLNEVFVRREMVGSFMQNLLQTHEQHFLGELLQRGEVRREHLDAVVFRPSEAFVRRHGLHDELDRRQDGLTQHPDEPGAWLAAGQLLIHMGRHREATFFLEQALERFPGRHDLRTEYGRALSLSGELARGEEQLRAAIDAGATSAAAAIALALTRFARVARFGDDVSLDDEEVGDGTRAQAEIRALVDRALDGGDADDVRPRMYGGWLLTALPPAFRDLDRGLTLLTGVCRELEAGAPGPATPAGHPERLRINTAYLLHEALGRVEHVAEPASVADCPDARILRELIFRLDPGCDFAERVYLEDGPAGEGDR